MYRRSSCQATIAHHERTAIDLDHREWHTCDQEPMLARPGDSITAVGEQHVNQGGQVIHCHACISINISSQQVHSCGVLCQQVINEPRQVIHVHLIITGYVTGLSRLNDLVADKIIELVPHIGVSIGFV